MPNSANSCFATDLDSIESYSFRLEGKDGKSSNDQSICLKSPEHHSRLLLLITLSESAGKC